jgi:hypothetical protein
MRRRAVHSTLGDLTLYNCSVAPVLQGSILVYTTQDHLLQEHSIALTASIAALDSMSVRTSPPAWQSLNDLHHNGAHCKGLHHGWRSDRHEHSALEASKQLLPASRSMGAPDNPPPSPLLQAQQERSEGMLHMLGVRRLGSAQPYGER